jgi:hypothetical protein
MIIVLCFNYICKVKVKITQYHDNQRFSSPSKRTEPVFVGLVRSPGIDSQPGGPVRNPVSRTGPTGYIGWRNRFLRIDSSESIPGLHKRLQIRARTCIVEPLSSTPPPPPAPLPALPFSPFLPSLLALLVPSFSPF